MARIQRRLAEVYYSRGNNEEAESLYETAETIRRELQGDESDAPGDSERSYNLLVACYFR